MIKNALLISMFIGIVFISSACEPKAIIRNDSSPVRTSEVMKPSLTPNKLATSEFNENVPTAEATAVVPTIDVETRSPVNLNSVKELDFKLAYFEKTDNAQYVWIYDYKLEKNDLVFTFYHDDALPFKQMIWSESGDKILIPSFGRNGIELHLINLIDLQVSKMPINLDALEIFEEGEFFRDLKIVDWSIDELFVALEIQKGFVEKENKEEFVILLLNLSDERLESLGADTIFLQWSEREPAKFTYLHRLERHNQGFEDLVLMVGDVKDGDIVFKSQIVENLSIQGPRPVSAWNEEKNIIVFDVFSTFLNEDGVRSLEDGLMSFDINEKEDEGRYVSLPYQPKNWSVSSQWLSFEQGKFADGKSLNPVIIEYKDDFPRSLGWINQSDNFLILENDADVIIVNPNDPTFRKEVRKLSLDGVSEFTQYFSWVR